MKASDLLEAWCGSQRVGLLRRRPSQGMTFQYESAWVHGGDFAISQSMPLDASELTIGDDRAHSFFANLLPERAARTLIARRHSVPDDDFELLRAFGGECAGSLSVLPDGSEPDWCDRHAYERIDDKELGSMIFQRGWESADSSGNGAARLSLAGAQDKTTVRLKNGQLYPPRTTPHRPTFSSSIPSNTPMCFHTSALPRC